MLYYPISQFTNYHSHSRMRLLRALDSTVTDCTVVSNQLQPSSYLPHSYSSIGKSEMAVATILKVEKLPYLCNGLTDRHKIWYDDAVCPS